MWIEFIKTYSGPLGVFQKGLRTCYVPDETIKKLPKGCYKTTCAPWDDLKDPNLEKIAAAQANVDNAARNLEALLAALVKTTGMFQEALQMAELNTKVAVDTEKQNEAATKEAERLEKLISKGEAKKADKETLGNLLKKIERFKVDIEILPLRAQVDNAHVAHCEALVILQGVLAERAKADLQAAQDELDKLKPEVEDQKNADDAKG